MTARDIVYILTAAGGMIAVGFKFRYLRQRWQAPQIWALCASIFTASISWWAAAPTNIHLLNDATGFSNFTALLVYCLGVSFAASTLTLAVFWRYEPASARPKVLAIIAGYAATIAFMIGLFSISDVAVERVTDFETYYARQPTIAAMLMIYNVSAGSGLGILSFACLSWARSSDYADRPWLRRGLRLYGIGTFGAVLMFVEKTLAVVINWVGLHWLDTVNVMLPLFVGPPAMAAVLSAVVLPIWGPRLSQLPHWLRRWRAFWTLRPMHQVLHRVDPALVFVASGKRFDPYHRVRRQLTELSDFRWTLTPLFDPAVAETARRLGHEAGLAGEQLRATAEAAQLKAALANDSPGHRPGGDGAGDDEVIDGTDVDGELAQWLHIAAAFDSNIVAATLAHRRPSSQSVATPATNS
ncbi:MAB_1171c family putative transporter [Actinoplanes sp. NPDC051475]|uniref:MAB_1171c family putative transporter n=1 Tax=Actinoplanes sp. NPDC051475 TaxID=3157225 RepID=UPI0034505DE9